MRLLELRGFGSRVGRGVKGIFHRLSTLTPNAVRAPDDAVITGLRLSSPAGRAEPAAGTRVRSHPAPVSAGRGDDWGGRRRPRIAAPSPPARVSHTAGRESTPNRRVARAQAGRARRAVTAHSETRQPAQSEPCRPRRRRAAECRAAAVVTAPEAAYCGADNAPVRAARRGGRTVGAARAGAGAGQVRGRAEGAANRRRAANGD